MNLIVKLISYDDYQSDLADMAIIPLTSDLLQRIREEVAVAKSMPIPMPDSITYFNVHDILIMQTPHNYDGVLTESSIGLLDECRQTEDFCFIPELPEDMRKMKANPDEYELPGIDYVARRYFIGVDDNGEKQVSVMYYGYHKWSGTLFESMTCPTSEILSCLKSE